MENNLSGLGHSTESNPSGWRPTDKAGLDNGGLAQGQTSMQTTPNQGQGGQGQGQGQTQNQQQQSQGGQGYTDKIAETVTQAKDYLADKAGVVGGKLKDFATDDLGGMAEKAKDFARQNPGQALLVAAGAGLLLGLIVRGRR
jgi:ElaB/YqjD/DUF883 family membrane-anchored ribosome-binding protein